ncbi:MAG: hypothetical protein WA020_10190 [Candidatus Acidiferrales bacterium]
MAAAEDEVPKANAFPLHAVEQTAGPDEVDGQQAKTQQNDQPAWSRAYQQHYADSQERESARNPEGSACVLQRLEEKE